MTSSASKDLQSGGRRRDRLLSIGPNAIGLALGLAGHSIAAVRSLGGEAAQRGLDAGEAALGSAIEAALESPRTQRLLERALDQPGVQRLVGSAIGSDASSGAVDQLLGSDEVDRLVGEIARSPQVRGALAAQTTGLATEVASQVRTRAAVADSLAERIAQRLVGREPQAAQQPPAAPDR